MIRLTLPLPPSVNNLYCTVRGRRVKSAQGRAFSLAVAHAVTERGCVPVAGAVGVRLRVFRRRKAGDLDNFTKALFDCLTGACWGDDSQIVYIESHRFDDKSNPRVEVEIWEVPRE